MLKTRSVLAIAALLPFVSHAGLSDSAGISGEVSVIGGVISTNSNLSTSGDSIKEAPLNSEGKKETDSLFGGLGSLAFTFGQGLNQQLFVGTSREDIAVGTLALEMGYRYQFESGTKLSLSYLPTLLELSVWEDPFLEGVARSETDKSGHAYRVKLDNIGGTLISLDMAYAEADVETDNSGSALALSAAEQQSLKRSGDALYTKLSYRQFLGRGLGLAPSIVYRKSNADGDAMASETLGGELTYFSFAGRNNIILTGKYLNRDYDAINPVFNQTRSDTEYGAFLAYEFGQLAGIDSLSFITLAGYTNIDSNIDFYSSSQYIASLGVTYRF